MKHRHLQDANLREQAFPALMLFLALGCAHAAPTAPGDAQLQQLIAEATRNNPEIRAAANERLAAQHRVSPAGALDDPMLEAGLINATWPNVRSNREDMTMKMLGLSQRFPFPGKRDLRQSVAARDAESVAHAYQETVNRVVREVRTMYFDLAYIAESARLVEKNRHNLGQFLRISESRYAVGQGTQADVLKAQTQLSKMADELLKLARERQAMEAELARARGRGAEGGVAPMPAALTLHETALHLETLREAALRNRPQLRGLRSLIERNGKTLDLARRDYYPDFDVKVAFGQRDKTADGMRRDDMLSFTVAINLPIWRETKRDPRVAEAVAMRDQSMEMYQAQVNELTSKLRQQVAGAEQGLRSARLYETGILPQARLALESSLAAYRVNRTDFLSLLDSQMTVLNYEVAYAAALAGYNKALAEIDLLTGEARY